MKQLDELRQRVVDAKARDDEFLNAAAREDLPKWVSLIEFAINSSPEAKWADLTLNQVRGWRTLFSQPKDLVTLLWTRGAPSIDVYRVRGNKSQYAHLVTTLLGPPFKLEYNYSSGGYYIGSTYVTSSIHSFKLSWR